MTLQVTTSVLQGSDAQQPAGASEQQTPVQS
jgi:hypothetical protein